MTVRRIVANIGATRPVDAQRFYGDVLGLDVVMDHGWIVTFGSDATQMVQLSIASEGGSGMPVPDLSIEVDDVDALAKRFVEAGFPLVYGPVDEPWGVRRFYVRDPFDRLVNVLSHAH